MTGIRHLFSIQLVVTLLPLPPLPSSSSLGLFTCVKCTHMQAVCTCEGAGDHLGVSADLRLRQNLFAIWQLSWTQQARESTSFQRVSDPCLSSHYWSTWSTGVLCFTPFYRDAGDLNTDPHTWTASNLPIMPLCQPLWFFLHSINW